ncbi:hypothetical protein AKN93_10805 [Thiopseudomonas alkaliphila]|uniref:deaminase n=1 Tax=Thiopseudomonas alkaliphila TaxID=1697053 RepID=UPI00069CBE8C|nr:deaminase [Thiopseudomonas alkaliphila]AKX46726.1 hypothetical protein AKN94_04640 [Thiopseudomonas alkaliphila]AKX49830.1 hypothetical protein AKN93_10805 [Thiopseudomonas alkaliphila]
MKLNEIQKIYDDLRDGFSVIGLTGAIGSGCTTAAKFLARDSSHAPLDDLQSAFTDSEQFDKLETYRARRIKQFLQNKSNRKPFHIKVSNLLFSLFFASDMSSKTKKYRINEWLKSEEDIEKSKKLSDEIFSIIINKNESSEKLSKKLEELDTLINNSVDKQSASYTEIFQKIGDKFRKHGLQKYFQGASIVLFTVKSTVFTISEFIRLTINNLKKEKYNFFIIDALRNIFEINFFKARYANFFLFSINATEKVRNERLTGNFSFSSSQLTKVQTIEKNKKKLNSQNINACISSGDIFIKNDSDKKSFYYQLLKYSTLIRKPGLFTPTTDERNMQIALTARYNSGCISRQVGACVVGKDGYILGVGWNDVSEGSIPCIYRTAHSLLIDNNQAPEFSTYETSAQFKDYLRNALGPKNQPFCFKDHENNRHIQQEINSFKNTLSQDGISLNDTHTEPLNKLFKNPTRERALHAEENAFLQSSKIGGGSLKDATLYTTDSPCQLCAKKAMQLGIKRIVYIDAYPDISNTQTLESGPIDKRPKLDAFAGVAESAFMRLFKPLIGIKDELSAIK